MSYNESLNPNSNYPHMSQSEWDNAPWNQQEMPERDFTANVSVTLSRKVLICTNDYVAEYDTEDGSVSYDTSNTKWVDEYKNQCYTIPMLLEKLKEYISKELQQKNGKDSRLQDMLEACDDWEVDELVVDA